MSEAPILPPSIHLDLTVDEFNLITAGLGKLLAEQSFPLLMKMQTAFNQQRNDYIIATMASQSEAPIQDDIALGKQIEAETQASAD